MFFFDWGSPAVEPVSIADMRLHSRVDVDDDDDVLSGLIAAARGQLEHELRRCLIERDVVLTLDGWPDDGCIRLPGAPVQSVSSVGYTDEDGSAATVASGAYVVDTAGARLVLKSSASWPAVTLHPVSGIAIAYRAGYGDQPEDVPQVLRQALQLLVAHWYEHREAVVIQAGVVATELPLAVQRIVSTHRWSWF